MALTPVKLAQTATGWTDSANATGTSIDVATAVCAVAGAGFAQSPSLVLGQFALDCLGVALIDSLFIRVCAKSDASNAVLSVYLARNGVQRGAIKTIPLDATLQEVTLGGDLWGTALTDADCYGLQVVCFVNALNGGVHSISYVSARAVFPTGDAVPTAFAFASQTSVPFATVRTSDPITVSGTDIASCVSIANGEWEKNGNSAWGSADGSVITGDTLRVRHTSASTAGITMVSALTVGSFTATFTTLTTTADTTPNTIVFPSGSLLYDMPLGLYATSGQAQITGINAPAPISIVGGQYSINGGAFTADAGTINNLDWLEIRCLASTTFDTATSATVTVGGVSTTLNVYSVRKYGTFTPFFFVTQTAVALGTPIISNSITFSGWGEQFTISISGGEFSLNGAAFRTTPRPSALDGDSVVVRHTSAAATVSTVTTTITVTGATSGTVYTTTFTTTTAGADITPDAFAFASLTNVENTQTFISSAGAIAGINVPVPVSASGSGLVSIAGGAYAANGSITSGQTLSVKLVSSAQPGYTTSTTVTVGAGSADFSVKTDYIVNVDF